MGDGSADDASTLADTTYVVLSQASDHQMPIEETVSSYI